MSNVKEKVIPLSESRHIDGSRVGRIVRIDSNGTVWSDYDSNPHGPLAARICGSVQRKLSSLPEVAGTNVLIIFENGRSDRPVITDVILDDYFSHSESSQDPYTEVELLPNVSRSQDVVIDGEKITFDAKEQIEFRCGKSSIILTRNGKVIIKGAYLLNRSTGVNHIKGGSVKIN